MTVRKIYRDVYLVRPRISETQQLLSVLFWRWDSLTKLSNPDHQFYVPPIGIFGHFKYNKEKRLVLSEKGPFYSVSDVLLKECKDKLANGSLVIVKQGRVLSCDIESLAHKVKNALRLKEEYTQSSNSLLDYLK